MAPEDSVPDLLGSSVASTAKPWLAPSRRIAATPSSIEA
jgi:hypothetical protein